MFPVFVCVACTVPLTPTPPVTTSVPEPVLVLAVPWVIVTAPLAATPPVPNDALLTAPLTPTPPVTTSVPVPVLVLAVPPVSTWDAL